MFLFCLVCIYMHGCVRMSPQKEVRRLGESVLSFLHVDPRHWTEAIRLDGKCPFIGLYREAICNPSDRVKLCPLDVAGRDQGFCKH